MSKVLNKAVSDGVTLAIARTRSNIKWFSQNNQFLSDWLNNYVPLKRKQIFNFYFGITVSCKINNLYNFFVFCL